MHVKTSQVMVFYSMQFQRQTEMLATSKPVYPESASIAHVWKSCSCLFIGRASSLQDKVSASIQSCSRQRKPPPRLRNGMCTIVRMKYYRYLSFKNSRLSNNLCQLQLKMCKMSNSADLTLIYSRSLEVRRHMNSAGAVAVWVQK